jgi:hypothetical protein
MQHCSGTIACLRLMLNSFLYIPTPLRLPKGSCTLLCALDSRTTSKRPVSPSPVLYKLTHPKSPSRNISASHFATPMSAPPPQIAESATSGVITRMFAALDLSGPTVHVSPVASPPVASSPSHSTETRASGTFESPAAATPGGRPLGIYACRCAARRRATTG